MNQKNDVPDWLYSVQSMLDYLEDPTAFKRKAFYGRLLEKSLTEIKISDGALFTCQDTLGAERIQLVAVQGLLCEMWAGENIDWNLSPCGEAADKRVEISHVSPMGKAVYFPLIQNNRIYGVLSVNLGNEKEILEDQRQVIKTVCSGLASITAVSRQLHERQGTLKQLDALNRAGALISQGRDIRLVLQILTEQAQEVMSAEAASVFLLNETDGELYSEIATGPKKEQLREIRLKKGEGVAGWVAEHAEPILVLDAATDERFNGNVDQITRFTTRDILCVPITRGDEVLGVIEVLNKTGGKQFLESEIPVLKSLADMAAIAIENARLNLAAEEKARRLDQDLGRANIEVFSVKNRLESVLFAMEDGVIAADENGRVVLMNRAAQIIAFGLSHQDPTGRLLTDVIADSFFSEKLGELRVSGEIQKLELELDVPDSRFFALVMTPILDLDGFLSGLVVVLRDITDFKELEKLKTAFLNTVSHELRTPMTSIRAFSELMARGKADDGKVLEWSAVIYDEAVRLGRLIDDLLDVSRIEAGKQLTIQRTQTEIMELFRRVCRLFEKDSENHRISLNIPAELEYAEIDGDRIEQVMANLISNAIKYSPQGGTVSVNVFFREPDLMRVEVQDSGLGLTENEIEHVFDKFYRVESKGMEGIRGTGLGLSITRYIVEQHQGEIGVESQKNHGSTFWFEIPIFIRS